MSNNLSKLDASMIRCGVVFIYCYRFYGTIDENDFSQSVFSVLSHIKRFSCSMSTDDKYRAQWQEKCEYSKACIFLREENFSQAFTSIYQTIACDKVTNTDNLSDESKHAILFMAKTLPMFFIVINDSERKNSFSILQCGQHSYCDGNSSSLIFNQLIRYYNAEKDNNHSEKQRILNELSSLSSPAPGDIFSFSFKTPKHIIPIDRWKHIKNIAKIMTYKIVDNGQYATSHQDLPSLFSQFRSRHSQPLMHYFDVNRLIESCSQHQAHVSPHNMVCALVAKAFYRINAEEKNLKNAHTISFRVMIDILNFPMRKKYIGNYIAYLPVTVDGRLPLHTIADHINERLYKAKVAKEDVSMYKMLEFALSSGMANKNNDPVSYIIANINNVTMMNNPYSLKGAECYEHKAIANAWPQDIKGAQLNNRPTLCFNLLSNNQLFLGFFNTVTEPAIPTQLVEKIKSCLAEDAIATPEELAMP